MRDYYNFFNCWTGTVFAWCWAGLQRLIWWRDVTDMTGKIWFYSTFWPSLHHVSAQCCLGLSYWLFERGNKEMFFLFVLLSSLLLSSSLSVSRPSSMSSLQSKYLSAFISCFLASQRITKIAKHYFFLIICNNSAIAVVMCLCAKINAIFVDKLCCPNTMWNQWKLQIADIENQCCLTHTHSVGEKKI